ncbi:H-2 class II histocompatibility antigen, A-U alpha chain-like [Polypterus senegalus]|uniref:H-2 class II histocompatibility antigen, A-U alpha chain-like n=1 Tax=Polypterus senegalus TaxID=55291 RepID=UPI0019626662|nr:H-2 class II histocompatibility antigen, A-U alpha chain-like [Polypterus senegalus]XP_039624894.1 H-2 class II histocompatibility antigen, A-U alpha chain-like [Polypterus senegalus]
MTGRKINNIFLLLITFLFGVTYTFTQKVPHKDINLVACQSGVSETEDEMGLDGDEILHVDFDKKETIIMLPKFTGQIIYPTWEQMAEANKQVCLNNLNVSIKAEGAVQEEKDPPRVMVFPENDLVKGEPNTLICFVTDFHPSAIKVSWTKNGLPVSEGITLSQYYPNEDFTFRIYSYLSFTPQLGDLYTCSVEHSALSEILTKFWEPEMKSDSDFGPTIFCAVGLTFGLLGVVTGTFFLIKGNNCS